MRATNLLKIKTNFLGCVHGRSGLGGKVCFLEWASWGWPLAMKLWVSLSLMAGLRNSVLSLIVQQLHGGISLSGQRMDKLQPLPLPVRKMVDHCYEWILVIWRGLHACWSNLCNGGKLPMSRCHHTSEIMIDMGTDGFFSARTHWKLVPAPLKWPTLPM